MPTGELTLGGFVAWAERDRDAAWSELQDLAQRIVRRLARRYSLQAADCEDIGDVVFLRALAGDLTALRRKPPTVPLTAWLTVTARNVARERRRGEARRTRAAVERECPGYYRPRGHPESPTSTRHLQLDDLTSAQRAVVASLIDGRSERDTAAILGMTRDRVHDIKRRAIVRLRKATTKAPPCADRSWALVAAERERTRGHEVTTRVLELYAANTPRARIAAETGLTEVAVKERIHRRRPRG